jgi:hypothetical protein
VGGLGTKPEYGVKSIDRFLTSLSRIEIEVKDQWKLTVLTIWVRPKPLRPLPRRAEVTLRGLAEASVVATSEAGGNAEKRGEGGLAKTLGQQVGPEQTRNVPPNQQLASSSL